MPRFLVTLNYDDGEYSVTTTASNEKNAIEFNRDNCIRVAVKATGDTDAQIRENITESDFSAVQI